MRSKPARFLLIGLLALLIIMPFHAFLTTWLGTAFDIRIVLQAWKEILLLGLLAVAGWLIWRNQYLRQSLLHSKLFWAIVIYACLHVLLAAFMPTPLFAELLGLKYNLGFLATFIVAVVAGFFIITRQALESKLIGVILTTSGLVAAFALLQALFLPSDWLAQFGYGVNTIAPFQPIQDSQVTRVISTLGGPNQLGSFLLLPLSLSLYLGIMRRNWRFGMLSVLFILALFFSHSRSAWIGAVVATALVVYWCLARKTFWRIGLAAGALAVVGGGLIFANIERWPYLQSTFLHSNYEKAFDASSNVDHFIALSEGAEATLENPLGDGPGSAGPASFETDNQLITESYYLQLGVEVGLLGLGLFLTIMYFISKALWRQRSSSLAIPLLASFWGVAFINFLLHTWTDSSTALVWWTVAGLIYTGVDPKIKNHLELL